MKRMALILSIILLGIFNANAEREEANMSEVTRRLATDATLTNVNTQTANVANALNTHLGNTNNQLAGAVNQLADGNSRITAVANAIIALPNATQQAADNANAAAARANDAVGKMSGAFNSINENISNIYAFPLVFEQGYLIRDDGSRWDVSGYGTSGAITVEAGKRYDFTSVDGTTLALWISWFASNDTFISGVAGYSSPVRLTAPSNAAYVRVGVIAGHQNKTCVLNVVNEYGTIHIEQNPVYNDSLQKSADEFASAMLLDGCENLALRSSYKDGIYRNVEGNDYPAPAWKRSDYIKVSPNKAYYANYTTFVNYYNASFQMISAEATPTNRFTTPATCEYIVISINVGVKSYALVDKNVFINKGRIIYVGANEEYTKLIDAVTFSNNNRNTTIVVKAGTYDIISEYGGQSSVPGTGEPSGTSFGMQIGNGTTIIFEPGAEVVCNYTGGDETVEQGFSIFNAIHPTGNSDYKIVGLVCRAKNIRYCIHDEMASSTLEYTHEYVDCNMYLDNTESSWTATQCIGGGLGTHGNILVDNCIFEAYEADDAPAISWHNHFIAGSKSIITVRDCYIIDGSIIFFNHGDQTDYTICKVSNTSAKYAPTVETIEDAPNKIILYAWNNEVRND